MEKKISITKLIAGYTIGIFFVPILLISIGSSLLFWYYSKNEIKRKNEIYISALTNKLEIVLENGKNIIFNLSLLDRISDSSPVIKMRNEIYTTRIGSDNLFDSMVFYNNDGEIMRTIPDSLVMTYTENNFSGKMHNETNNNRSVYIDFGLSPYTNKNSVLIISNSLYDEEDRVVVGYIDFDKIISSLSIYNTEMSGYNLVLTNQNNDIIFDSTKFLEDDRQFAADIKTYSRQSNFTYTKNNKSYIVTNSIMSDYGWTLFLFEDLNVIYKPMHNLHLLFFIVLGFGLLFAFLGVYKFRKIIDVLTTISLQSAKVAHGDYSIEIENSVIKELNIVAINFRKMIKKIILREKELRESEQNYRKLVEDNLDFVFRVNRNLEFTYISNSIESILGYTSKDFTEHYRRYFSDQDLTFEAAKKIKSLFLLKKSSEQFNIEVNHRNGYKVVLEIQVKSIFNRNEVVEVQGVARDVTTRFYAEKENEYLSNYLSNLIETLPIALIAVNSNGVITQVNSAACLMFKKSRYDFIDHKPERVLYEMKSIVKMFPDILDNGKGVEFTESFKIDNNSGYFDVRIIPLLWKSHKGILLLIEDITTRIIAEENLRQAQKMETIGTLAGGLAHDFNNILGGILGTVTIIEYTAKSKKKLTFSAFEEDIGVLKDAVKKATDLSKQLLTISKSHRISKTNMDINEEIKKVVSICSKSFSKLISIHTSYYKEQAIINFSTTNFEQIALNLLFNAKDAIEIKGGSGRIDVDIGRIASGPEEKRRLNIQEGMIYWIIKIKDNGCGFNGDLRKQIFDPYFTTKEKGTGLGLTMTYNIIKQAQGYIDVFSETDKGTEFIVYLPYENIDYKNLEHKSQEKTKIEQGSGYILHIDDEDFILNSTGKMLSSCGYLVTSAINGKNGLKIYNERKDNIDIVILDIMMPDMSGLEVFAEIRKINKNVKILLSSALNPNPDELKRLNITEDIHFIQKPYTIEEISKVIKDLIGI